LLKPYPWSKPIPLTFAFEDSFTLISTKSDIIEKTGKFYSQNESHDRSFIKDLLSLSVEDGLNPYCLLGDFCQE